MSSTLLCTCIALERASFYIYTGTYLHLGCHKLLLTLVDYLPTTCLTEIAHVMPDETPRYQHQFSRMLDWPRLQVALDRFPNLSVFRVVKRSRFFRGHHPAGDRLREWALDSSPFLVTAGRLHFE